MVPRTQATFTPVRRSATLRFSNRVPTQAGFARKVSVQGTRVNAPDSVPTSGVFLHASPGLAVSARERGIVSHTSSEARCVYRCALEYQVRSMTIILEFLHFGRELGYIVSRT